MARPSKLTPETQATIIEVISTGGYIETACQRVGINSSQFRRWMQRGIREPRGKYRTFRTAIKKAEAECEHKMVQAWVSEMPGNWQAIATFLERRHPERWSKDRLKLKEHEDRLKELERAAEQAKK